MRGNSLRIFLAPPRYNEGGELFHDGAETEDLALRLCRPLYWENKVLASLSALRLDTEAGSHPGDAGVAAAWRRV